MSFADAYLRNSARQHHPSVSLIGSGRGVVVDVSWGVERRGMVADLTRHPGSVIKTPDVSTLLRTQICILTIQLVILESDIDVLITFDITPGCSLVD